MKLLIKSDIFEDPDNPKYILQDTICRTMVNNVIIKEVLIPHIDMFDTGDIILFSERTYVPSRLLEWFTDTKYTHIGLILKDPVYIDPKMKGCFILEVTRMNTLQDAGDTKIIFDVHTRKIEDVYRQYDGAIYWRKLNAERDEKFYQSLIEVFETLQFNTLDTSMLDWIETIFNIKIDEVPSTDKFFCSILVSYIYYRLGILDSSTLPTIITPRDFGTENVTNRRIEFINCSIDIEVLLKGYDSYVHYIYYTY